jgi:hypothetical protein
MIYVLAIGLLVCILAIHFGCLVIAMIEALITTMVIVFLGYCIEVEVTKER